MFWGGHKAGQDKGIDRDLQTKLKWPKDRFACHEFLAGSSFQHYSRLLSIKCCLHCSLSAALWCSFDSNSSLSLSLSLSLVLHGFPWFSMVLLVLCYHLRFSVVVLLLLTSTHCSRVNYKCCQILNKSKHPFRIQQESKSLATTVKSKCSFRWVILLCPV